MLKNIVTLLLVISTTIICGCQPSKINLYNYATMSAQQIYKEGKKAALDKNYAEAIKHFEALESRFPYGAYTLKTQLALIHAYYEKDDYSSALSTADKFIRLNPSHPNIDFAYYMRGMTHFKKNNSLAFRILPIDKAKRETANAQKSFDDFKLLTKKYPKSRYAGDARKRMIRLVNQIANHEIYVAKYYLEQGAYLAAANRANYVITEFQNSESVPLAIATLVRSYRAMGMQALATEALNTLKENYPNSDYLKQLS